MISITRKAINIALQTIAGSTHITNNLGLYHAEFRAIFPCNTRQKRHRVHYFYRHVCTKPSQPTDQSDVEDIIARAVRLVKERVISSGDSETNTYNDDGENQITENKRKNN